MAEAYKGPSRTRLLQNRISFIKLSSRVTQFEKKFHAATGMVETAYSKLAKASASEVIALLRNWVRTSEKDVNAVFDEASKGNAEIDETRFSELVQAGLAHTCSDDLRRIFGFFKSCFSSS